MTLAALKRTIEPGTRLRVVAHWIDRYRDTERIVTRTQGNGYYFTFEGKEHWSPYPKAGRLSFIGEDTFTILPDEKGRGWTLQIL